MEKINFQNGVTKVNADTFNTFQNNIENAINNIQISEDTPSSRFEQIEVNKVIINNKMVEVNFKGHLTSEITNNTAMLANIPEAIMGSRYTTTIYIGGRYDIQTAKWAYITNNQLRGDYLPANTWVHISFSYIKY